MKPAGGAEEQSVNHAKREKHTLFTEEILSEGEKFDSKSFFVSFNVPDSDSNHECDTRYCSVQRRRTVEEAGI